MASLNAELVTKQEFRLMVYIIASILKGLEVGRGEGQPRLLVNCLAAQPPRHPSLQHGVSLRASQQQARRRVTSFTRPPL